MTKITREHRSPEKGINTRATRRIRRSNNLPPPNIKELTNRLDQLSSPSKTKRTSSRGTDLPFPMMPYKEPPLPNNPELQKEFKRLCTEEKRNIRERWNRKVEKDYKDVDQAKFAQFSQRYGKDLGKLLLLSIPLFEIKNTVPKYLVHRGIVRDFPIKKEKTEAQNEVNKEKQQAPVPINIKFHCIGESEIPVYKNNEVTMVKAGKHLTYDDLNVAMNLVGKNVDNVPVILLLVFQYKTAMFNFTKENVLEGEEYEKDVKKAGRVLSTIDSVMEEKLADAANLTRSAWILASCADPDHDRFFLQPMRQYREEQRALYLEQLNDWDDSKGLSDEVKLRRCHFFHLFVIMSGSQGCKDEDGIERLNLLISGERTGSLSVCIPLRTCSIVEYINFIADVLKSGKAQGMDQLRVISFVEIAILCETVWKSELPSKYRDLCRVYQISDKKARVSLNGMGTIDGVGIDDHVKRFLKEVLQLRYSIKELYSLLDRLDRRTAANVNDNIAEIGQKLNNVKKRQGDYWEKDREWLKDLFSDLGSESEEMEEICRRWLEVYRVSF
mmetsp:Transcript_5087/g.7077  ORF Transcript_5087/g.7077 Transcript_5087/m.7077 type:complete len:555 (-) Transcript_5087:44-1708(-)